VTVGTAPSPRLSRAQRFRGWLRTPDAAGMLGIVVFLELVFWGGATGGHTPLISALAGHGFGGVYDPNLPTASVFDDGGVLSLYPVNSAEAEAARLWPRPTQQELGHLTVLPWPRSFGLLAPVVRWHDFTVHGEDTLGLTAPQLQDLRQRYADYVAEWLGGRLPECPNAIRAGVGKTRSIYWFGAAHDAVAVALLAAWLYSMACLPGALRRSSRARRGLCPSCGYDLAANTSGVCPECGSSAIPSATS
jgi:hypothetical protein